ARSRLALGQGPMHELFLVELGHRLALARRRRQAQADLVLQERRKEGADVFAWPKAMVAAKSQKLLPLGRRAERRDDVAFGMVQPHLETIVLENHVALQVDFAARAAQDELLALVSEEPGGLEEGESREAVVKGEFVDRLDGRHDALTSC